MIFCSLITGISALNSSMSGRIGLKTICYYVGTTIVAAFEGFAWIFAVRPGANIKLTDDENIKERHYSGVDGLLDVIRWDIFADNNFNNLVVKRSWPNFRHSSETSLFFKLCIVFHLQESFPGKYSHDDISTGKLLKNCSPIVKDLVWIMMKTETIISCR